MRPKYIMPNKRLYYGHGPYTGPARPAVGCFPFSGRTVEECDIDYEDLREACEENMRGRKW